MGDDRSFTADRADDRSPTSSIWDQPERAPFPALEPDGQVDVAVVGAGIVGLTTALLIARGGMTVRVLEARRIGDGTTGRSTAKVSALQGTRYRQILGLHGLDAARRHAAAQTAALAWIEEQAGSSTVECGWQRRTAVTYATSMVGERMVLEEAAAAAAAGLSVATDHPVDLPFRTSAAVFLEDQAQLSPRLYLEGLAADLRATGRGTIHELSRVLSIRGRGPHRVVTEAGILRAEHVVVATLLPVTDRALLFARTKPVASYTIAVRVDGPLPSRMYLSADEPTRSLRTAEHRGDQLLLVGGEGSRVATGASPTVAVERLVKWTREHFPVTELVTAWSAHDLASVDHLPWVGPTSPVTPRVLAATGFEKWGMTMGTAAAEMMARHILGEREIADSPWGIYDARRRSVRSLPGTAKTNLTVAARLASDWAFPDEPPDLHGEGRRYRSGLLPEGDPDGDPSSPPVRVICTHLGGVCRWNDLERTWDCPLHGSRFDADGAVVSGPAVRPLARPGSTGRGDDPRS